MGSNTDGTLPSLKCLDHMVPSHLLLYPLAFIGGSEAVHHHIIQEILAIVLESLPRECVDFLPRPSPTAHPLDVLSNIGSRLFHQQVKEVSDDDAEELLHGTGNESRTKRKEEEIDKSVKGQGVAFRHPNPQNSLSENYGGFEWTTDVSSYNAKSPASPFSTGYHREGLS
jgi:hypothetical protein